MIILIIFTLTCLTLSLILSREKTWLGIKKGLKMFFNLLPSLFTILIAVSIFLFLIPKELLSKILGKESGVLGMLIAALAGSISLIPGFIAFPLSAVLIKNGVGYPIIAVFVTTLMMVGIITLPLESKFFGWKAALIRNLFSFIGALIIGTFIAFLWRLI